MNKKDITYLQSDYKVKNGLSSWKWLNSEKRNIMYDEDNGHKQVRIWI